ncbi:MAG: hypothetical protein ACR2MN_00160 [Acidimicrobiales bacterium]
MTLAHNPVLIGVELLAGSVWVGSLVCLAVVAAAARASLDPAARVAFFRSLGRRYGLVGNGALAVAIGVGLTMGWPPSAWDGLVDVAVALTGTLVVVTVVGVRQARAMTRLRRRSLDEPTNEHLERVVRRGATTATMLRGLIAVLTLAVVAVAASIMGT